MNILLNTMCPRRTFKKNKRVFHGTVNYGTQSGLFAKKLREKGFNALSVTQYDRYGRTTDKVFKHNGKNLTEKIFNLISNVFLKIRCFFEFDIFHFYFGHTLSNRKFDLPFYKLFGKKIIFHYLGIDVQLYQASIDKYEVTNVRDYLKNGLQHDKKILKRLKFESNYADRQIVCAPYLSEFVPNSIVIPLAIDIDEYIFSPKKVPSDVVIMHAPTNRNNKGTEYILKALNRLINEGYKIKKLIVENVSHIELKEKYKECDIFIDQILAGWYGTAAIEAMAIGRPTVCFIRESYFEHITYGDQIPIINASPENIYDVLKNIIDKKYILPEIGVKSRQFVEQIHDSRKLTDTLIALYEKI